jgi:simple sugar transport system ATP-binding protein
LILDEPTAALTPQETAGLFKAMRKLSSSGRTIVFISHKLDEVIQISDRVTVLRNGANVGTRLASECEPRLLATMMVGQDVDLRNYAKEGAAGRVVLELVGISALGDRGRLALKGLSLVIREREILGIAGVAGNGQKELAEVLTGLRAVQGGKIALDGEEQCEFSPRRLAEAGIGHIPEDRIGRGLFGGLPVTHSAILRTFYRPPIRKGIWLSKEDSAVFAAGLLERGGIREGALGVRVRDLSGGNQQKLLVRREIETASRLLIAMHPTRGLDVVASDDVRRELVEHRNKGQAVLLISEDLDEVLELSDRVAVMFDGRIVGVHDGKNARREDIGLQMGGRTVRQEVG